MELEHGYHKNLVDAGMPSFDVSSASDAPFLFADDLAEAEEERAARSPIGQMGQAAVAGAPAWLQPQGMGEAASVPTDGGGLLIQAMVGVVNKTQSETEALDHAVSS